MVLTMTTLVAAATEQGFVVRQSEKGAWMFTKGTRTVTESRPPDSPEQWARLLEALGEAGFTAMQPGGDAR
ncbi:Uncharacterised protein [Mycobacteroides abscessus subsp. massiliense]|nr:hypothetical protein [Mycobacteroides abscessus]SLH53033.1 Uncharacterised protein [Mycobacteroides abscessus subsp. massiliense]